MDIVALARVIQGIFIACVIGLVFIAGIPPVHAQYDKAYKFSEEDSSSIEEKFDKAPLSSPVL